MKHLSPEQLVDVADGCAPRGPVAHAEACEACRAQVESIREAVDLAGTDPQPEPSPLFWPHLAARIGEAVRLERAPAAVRRSWGWRLIPVGAMAVLVIAAGLGLRVWSGTRDSGTAAPGAPVPPAPVQAAAEEDAGFDTADDPSWLHVSDLSADVSVEEAEASGALQAPGGVDRALAQLDDAERIELARILRAEMAPRTPATPQGPGA
jgi:hypothetical protein